MELDLTDPDTGFEDAEKVAQKTRAFQGLVLNAIHTNAPAVAVTGRRYKTPRRPEAEAEAADPAPPTEPLTR
jgi:hypothetical protein